MSITSIVTWTDRFGQTNTTRIVTAHLAAFTADVEESGGEVHESQEVTMSLLDGPFDHYPADFATDDEWDA